MTDTKTQTITSALDGGIAESAPLAVVPGGASDMDSLADFGFVMPVATPQLLRRAFAERQALMAAILDEHDYIYIVPYTDPMSGKQRQFIAVRREDAEKALGQYKTEILAKPKKSGIVKLAAALNIQCRRVKSSGLPEEPGATYAWVLYEATHQRTGRTEEGIGWCDKTEKGGRITVHELIATADTRAYNRAVLRLAGFGDVSADEILGGSGYGTVIETSGSSVVADVNPSRAAEPRPGNDQEIVLAAARTWADAVLARQGDRFIAVAQQSSKAFRELRARARRGDLQSAHQLGAVGLHWEGVAQDSLEYDTFQVEAPPISIDDVLRVRKAAEAQRAVVAQSASNGGTPAVEPASATPAPQAAPATPVAAPAAALKAAAAPSGGVPPPAEDCITLAQAKLLSTQLLAAVGTKEACVAWLTQHAGVATSRHVRLAQFDAVMTLIQKLPEA
jgi:hypothetical protein